MSWIGGQTGWRVWESWDAAAPSRAAAAHSTGAAAGSPWRLIDTERAMRINDMSWATSATGWRLESNSTETEYTLQRSIDTGHTWITQLELTDLAASLDFIDVNNGWVVGSTSARDAALVWSTDNSGESWDLTEIAPPPPASTFALMSVDFIDRGADPPLGFAIGSTSAGGVIYRSADGGGTWTSVTPSGMDDVTPADVAFADEQTGWVAGFLTTALHTYKPVLLATRDGGTTWVDQTPGGLPLGFLTAITTVDAQSAWAALTPYFPWRQAAVLRTADGGSSWSEHSVGVAGALADIAFHDTETGWVVGHDRATPNEQPVVRVTQDGGQTWVSDAPSSISVCETSMLCVPAAVTVADNRVYAAGYSIGPAGTTGAVLARDAAAR